MTVSFPTRASPKFAKSWHPQRITILRRRPHRESAILGRPRHTHLYVLYLSRRPLESICGSRAASKGLTVVPTALQSPSPSLGLRISDEGLTTAIMDMEKLKKMQQSVRIGESSLCYYLRASWGLVVPEIGARKLPWPAQMNNS